MEQDQPPARRPRLCPRPRSDMLQDSFLTGSCAVSQQALLPPTRPPHAPPLVFRHTLWSNGPSLCQTPKEAAGPLPLLRLLTLRAPPGTALALSPRTSRPHTRLGAQPRGFIQDPEHVHSAPPTGRVAGGQSPADLAACPQPSLCGHCVIQPTTPS